MCCPGFPGSKKRGGGAFKYLVSWICPRSFYLISNCSLSMFRCCLACRVWLEHRDKLRVQPCSGTACTSQDTFSVGVLGALGSSTRTRGINQTHRGKQQPTLTSPEQQQQHHHKRLKGKHPRSTQILQALSGFTKFCLNCPGYLFSLLEERLSVQLSSGILASSSLLSLPKHLGTKEAVSVAGPPLSPATLPALLPIQAFFSYSTSLDIKIIYL